MTTPSEAVRVAVMKTRLPKPVGHLRTDMWWPGDLYTEEQMREFALAALSLHVGDAADVQSDDVGATPAGSGSAACRPEPLCVSALRAPIPGAWQPIETAPTDGTVVITKGSNGRDQMICAMFRPAYAHEDGEGAARWIGLLPHCGEISCLATPSHWMPLPAPPEAQTIVTREGQDPQGLGGEAIERGPAGMRPEESRAQPSPHIEPAGWIENGKWRPNPLWSWAGPQTVAWSVPLYPLFPSPHIEPVARDEWLIPVELPDGRIAKMRKCDLKSDDLVAFIDGEALPPFASPTTPTEGPAQTNPAIRDALERLRFVDRDIWDDIEAALREAKEGHHDAGLDELDCTLLLDLLWLYRHAPPKPKVRAGTLTDPEGAAFRRLAEVTASLASAQQRIEELERALGGLFKPVEFRAISPQAAWPFAQDDKGTK